MQETLGVFKVRSLATKEKVFHAPDSAEGNYYLVFNKENGVVKYIPVASVEMSE